MCRLLEKDRPLSIETKESMNANSARLSLSHNKRLSLVVPFNEYNAICTFLFSAELSQSMMSSRLQMRLNPVPESLNSPDIPPAGGMTQRPARDDPLRVYKRDYKPPINHSAKAIYLCFINHQSILPFYSFSFTLVLSWG